MALSDILAKPRVQRFFWGFLRTFAPTFKFRNNVFISRYNDVLEVLKRDQDFTISEVNGKRMEELGIAFFLGMDKSPQHNNEFSLMAKVIKREDLGSIQNLVAQKAKELIEKAQSKGQIDVVNEYARLVPLHLIDAYFGIPVRDETKMKHWVRQLS